MGEWVKDLKRIDYGNTMITIELNEGNLNSDGKDIHIEMPPFRLEVTDDEFLRIVASTVEARSKMRFKRKGV